MLDAVSQFFRSYKWYEVVVEVAVIWLCVYLVFRFLRGTRGAGVIKGFAYLFVTLTLVIVLVGRVSDAFGRLNFIYERFLGLLAVVLVVVFQPELRQAMIRLGHARFFRGSGGHLGRVIDSVDEAVEFLSKNQFGALIAIEREVKLGGLVEGGESLDARVSARLLESIFWPNSPLHDLGVVVRGDRIVAANVQFPLIEEGMVPPNLGSRHRAAAGLSLESDSVIVIVSEETGRISIAERGRIEVIPRDEFKDILAERLQAIPDEPAQEGFASEVGEEDDKEGGEAEEEPPRSDPVERQPETTAGARGRT
ncbi:MAG: diadenylate cyclase [Planctomycetota bacterium]|jgi:diadenylate cyclase